jgi:hypothetical protein
MADITISTMTEDVALQLAQFCKVPPSTSLAKPERELG